MGAAIVGARQRPVDMEVVGHYYKPKVIEGGAATLQALDGFQVTRFADNLGTPRMLAVAKDGTVFVTRREPGDILALRDTNNDGQADEVRTAVRRPMLHGLALDGSKAYFVGVNDVFTADVQRDGTFANVVRIIDDLPEGGQHANRTVVLGPDRHLYISVGSTCNACDETSPENATMLRASLDGRSRAIFASGLRNTIGFAFHPDTGGLFGFDHGIDWLGDDEPAEELNRIERGNQYGWPYVYDHGNINPQDEPPGEMTGEEWARLSQPPVLTYTAHAAPMQMAFYSGTQFPAEFRGDAFVAMHGSWNRKPLSGYEVVRVRFDNGAPTSVEPFLTGFVDSRHDEPAIVGRPVGIAVARDGALLVADDVAGRIYRVAALPGARVTTTRRGTTAPLPRPVGTAGENSGRSTSGTASETNGDVRGPSSRTLAIERIPTGKGGPLTVSSPAFESSAAIPAPHSHYGERFSPALSWSGAPDDTRSFVILVEDPDAKDPTPFVHWVLYNVPAETTQLPESVPAIQRLINPEGALQGRNSRGQVGYFGPRPPRGDQPHHYHFQVFALDTTLSLAPGVSRESLLDAMRGHVIARGELVGTFEKER